MSDKAGKFRDLLEKRLANATKMISLLGNLSNSSNYDYTYLQVRTLFDNLETTIAEAKQAFEGARPWKINNWPKLSSIVVPPPTDEPRPASGMSVETELELANDTIEKQKKVIERMQQDLDARTAEINIMAAAARRRGIHGKTVNAPDDD